MEFRILRMTEMSNFKPLLIISLALVFNSCRTVVDWDLQSAEQGLTIESYISNEVKPWEVKLSRTRDYFDNNPADIVDDALVTISDDMGNTDTLNHRNSGLYVTAENMSCIPGHHYTLEVIFEGETFSSTELCREQLDIDTFFYFYQPEKNGFITPGYYVFELAQEIEPEGDYYQWRIFKNDTLQDDFGYVLDTDEFADFSYFNSNIDLDNITLEFLPRPFPFQFDEGDRIVLEQRCINKNFYDYLIEFQTQYDRQGSPFDSPPSNPTGNILGASGYFAVYNVVSRSLVIE